MGQAGRLLEINFKRDSGTVGHGIAGSYGYGVVSGLGCGICKELDGRSRCGPAPSIWGKRAWEQGRGIRALWLAGHIQRSLRCGHTHGHMLFTDIEATTVVIRLTNIPTLQTQLPPFHKPSTARSEPRLLSTHNFPNRETPELKIPIIQRCLENLYHPSHPHINPETNQPAFPH